jgi:putative colanic acid biosynthesis UDP-glucose lipid carrier transferase
MHADCNAFSLLIPGYKFRNLVKPGITGWAQVKGYHGKVTSRECIIKRYEWDARYIREAGFWLDIKIMATTATRGIGIVARYLISASFAPTLRSLRCSYRR